MGLSQAQVDIVHRRRTIINNY